MKIYKKHYLVLILISLLFISLFSETLPEQPSNFNEQGAGTDINPFLISNLANLRWLSETPEYWGGYFWNYMYITGYVQYYFLQTADIDASESKKWNNGNGFKPIGKKISLPLSGNGSFFVTGAEFVSFYDGNNFIVENLFISIPNIKGLSFGSLFGSTLNTTIRNIKINNIEIVHDNTYNFDSKESVLAPLAGFADKTKFSKCSVTGNISVTNANIDNSNWVILSGLIGSATNSEVNYCYSNFSISSDNTSEIRALGAIVGDLNRSSLKNSYFRGKISINNKMDVSGGLVGNSNNSKIENCYNIIQSKNEFVSGIAGYITKTEIKNSFWNVDTNNVLKDFFVVNGDQNILDNVKGFQTPQMKLQTTFKNWDFNNIWMINNETNEGYPFLNMQVILPLKTPSNLISHIDIDNLFLSWSSPETVSVGTFISYNIYKDGIIIKTTKDSCYTEIGLDNGLYSYYITAVYDVHSTFEESLPSNKIIVEINFLNNKDQTIKNKTTLIGNYPNPFNPSTIIKFRIENSEFRIDQSPLIKFGIRNSEFGIEGRGVGNPAPKHSFYTGEGRGEGIATVKIDIFNIKGQKIKTLVNGNYASGEHCIIWNGTDESNTPVSSGIYFYRLQTNNHSEIKNAFSEVKIVKSLKKQ